MLADDPGLTLKELCEESGVPERTVRYYMQQGLIPSASRSGPGVRYPTAHLWRLALVRRWQDEYLPLEQIRKLLSELDDAGVERLAKGARPRPPGGAADYVRAVLGKDVAAAAPAPPAPGKLARTTVSDAQRSQWERFVLDPDIELHVRRPLSHVMNRRVEALLGEARKILAGARVPGATRPQTQTRDDEADR